LLGSRLELERDPPARHALHGVQDDGTLDAVDRAQHLALQSSTERVVEGRFAEVSIRPVGLVREGLDALCAAE
jgi:hypothetical protein